MKTFRFPLWLFALTLLIPHIVVAQTQPVAVAVSANAGGADLPPRFLGLSYEMSMLLPKDGRYYFDSKDASLVNTFHTLGIRSLRVGANAVDDPRIPIPQETDIDELFEFARAAGVKVIYSFRLKHGDPADSARLASYITERYADALECFSVGNEPHLFRPDGSYNTFYTNWKPHYDAILRLVPQAMFDGPSANGDFALHLAKDMLAGGHMAMVSDHYYFLGSGRASETNPPATRARFLSNHLDKDYARDYARVGAVLAAEGALYRIDEMNSCYNGGAKDSSDTYASTLWALDCTHWWAAHHILGVNFHTGESVGRDGKFGPPNYASFLRQTDGLGFAMRPQAYALLSFTQGAHGQPLRVTVQATNTFNFNAYAYQDHDGSIYVTLINKSYGDKAQAAAVSLQLPDATASGTWKRMDLVQKDQDVAAKKDVMLGGAAVDEHGNWAGQWETLENTNSGEPTVQVAPASAAILHFSTSK
jgi:hypothetical protein